MIEVFPLYISKKVLDLLFQGPRFELHNQEFFYKLIFKLREELILIYSRKRCILKTF